MSNRFPGKLAGKGALVNYTHNVTQDHGRDDVRGNTGQPSLMHLVGTVLDSDA